MRDDGTDLSLEVRQFCRDRNVSVPAPKPSAPPAYPPGSANAPYFSRSTQCEPRTKSMEDTTFNDLFLRVGAFIAIQIISYHAGFHTAESSVQSCVNMVVGVVSIEVSCMALSVLCNWDRAPKLHIGARDSAGKPSACSLFCLQCEYTSSGTYCSGFRCCTPQQFTEQHESSYNQLQVGQGAGYVYVHQGCCEHLLELTDVRRAHDADPLLINHYPQVLDQVLSHKSLARSSCKCPAY